MKSWYNQIKDTCSYSCRPYFLFSSVQENKTYHTTDLKHFLFSNIRRSIEWYSVYLQCLSVSFWLIGFSVWIKNVLWVITLIKIHIYFASLHLSYIFLPQVRQKWNGIWCINLCFYSKNFSTEGVYSRPACTVCQLALSLQLFLCEQKGRLGALSAVLCLHL